MFSSFNKIDNSLAVKTWSIFNVYSFASNFLAVHGVIATVTILEGSNPFFSVK